TQTPPPARSGRAAGFRWVCSGPRGRPWGAPTTHTARRGPAAGGGLAILQTGDQVRIDLKKGTANILISDEEIAKRRAELVAAGGYVYPESQTPWQEIQRSYVGQMETGAVLEPAVKYQRIAQTKGIPRDNH
ncbi:dihydroxy-acid dehydratase, partial [Rhizobium sp. Rhizsp42]|uniref:dihydroxy-acid dehydratase domain-containing protein n=1 Tax=Rhizobium sp. Rhizsp42 TaxID=3243034 RepID=UPI0039B04583